MPWKMPDGPPFSGTKNAEILSEQLRALGNGRLTWKLSKKFSKTLTIVGSIVDAPSWKKGTKEYLCGLVFDDAKQSLSGELNLYDVPPDILQRFIGHLRNSIAHRMEKLKKEKP